MPDREDMKSILEACRRTGPMDESLVRGTVESSSSNSESITQMLCEVLIICSFLVMKMEMTITSNFFKYFE